MTLPWRFRFLVLYAVIVVGLSLWVVIRTRRGSVPDEWWYALTVYVATPFGLPWSMLFAGWWIYLGLLFNGAVLFGLGWLVEGWLQRPA